MSCDNCKYWYEIACARGHEIDKLVEWKKRAEKAEDDNKRFKARNLDLLQWLSEMQRGG